jgi:hypothetical protein
MVLGMGLNGEERSNAQKLKCENMSQTYELEFYINKKPLNKEVIFQLIESMKEINLNVIIDNVHAPSFRNPTSPHRTYDECSKLSLEETIDIILNEGGGSIPFISKVFSYQLHIYPMGWAGNKERAKALHENIDGEIPYGTINFWWQYLTDHRINREKYIKTIEVGHIIYNIFKPVYGCSYIDEIWDSKYYYLIPTEWNIYKHGPRDMFPINFWGSQIAEKIDHQKLKQIQNLIIIELEDGGVLIHLPPDDFIEVEYGALRKGEKLLGWINKSSTKAKYFNQ